MAMDTTLSRKIKHQISKVMGFFSFLCIKSSLSSTHFPWPHLKHNLSLNIPCITEYNLQIEKVGPWIFFFFFTITNLRFLKKMPGLHLLLTELQSRCLLISAWRRESAYIKWFSNFHAPKNHLTAHKTADGRLPCRLWFCASTVELSKPSS